MSEVPQPWLGHDRHAGAHAEPLPNKGNRLMAQIIRRGNLAVLVSQPYAGAWTAVVIDRGRGLLPHRERCWAGYVYSSRMDAVTAARRIVAAR